MGGYPDFIQGDPRYLSNPNQEKYTLLMQIDSEVADGGKNEICWGDGGIANFFIKLSKLRELDFSDVWYNWDCG